MVRNPFNSNQVSRVSLKPKDVEAIVFWTKNPKPMLKNIKDLDKLGYRFYFQFTLNNYPKELEPNIPDVKERLSTFKQLSEMIGKERVIWRYDPIILSNITDFKFHKAVFGKLFRELREFTNRVVVSIIDFYSTTKHNLGKLEKMGFDFLLNPEENLELIELLCFFSKLVKDSAIEIFTCAERRNYSNVGIPPGKCIDDELIEKLWDIHLSYKKDLNQRKSCGCVVSKDIGANDTCLHNCPYCYATKNGNLAYSRYKKHNSSYNSILDNLTISDLNKKGLQLKLFK